MPTVLLRRNVVKQRVIGSDADSTFDDLRARDATFPKPVHPFGTRTPVWIADEIENWITQRIAAERMKEK